MDGRLRGFYGIIKDSADRVRLIFVIGVSMFLQNFSKVSLFSGLNNLGDINFDPHYATICGCPDNDVDHVFGQELDGLDRKEIRRRYNGHHRRGGERVHNPDDVLLLFDSNEFRPYWFENGSPGFLFQTGYLTIAEERRDWLMTFYRLDYPNLAGQFSQNDQLLAHLVRRGKNR